MSEPKKILVAIDGSENSIKAARFAILLAKKFDAFLFIVNVIQFPGYVAVSEPTMSKTVDSVLEAYRRNAKEKSSERLSKIASTATSEGVKVETEILDEDSSIVGAIVDYATKRK